jgi:hypothetical protein
MIQEKAFYCFHTLPKKVDKKAWISETILDSLNISTDLNFYDLAYTLSKNCKPTSVNNCALSKKEKNPIS